MVHVAFAIDTAIDTHDREIMSWVATAGQGISGELVRDMMLGCVERRFGTIRAPHPVQWPTDNGSPYAACETIDLATALNLVACFTPVRSPDSNGIRESFLKTLKRDCVQVNPCPNPQFVLHHLPAWLEDYNTIHPHSGLRMLSPRESINQQSSTPAPVRSDGEHSRKLDPSTPIPSAARTEAGEARKAHRRGQLATVGMLARELSKLSPDPSIVVEGERLAPDREVDDLQLLRSPTLRQPREKIVYLFSELRYSETEIVRIQTSQPDRS